MDYFSCPNCKTRMHKVGTGHVCPLCKIAVTATWVILKPVTEDMYHVPNAFFNIDFAEIERKVLLADSDCYVNRANSKDLTFEEIYGKKKPSFHDLFKGVIEIVKDVMDKDNKDNNDDDFDTRR